MLSKFYNDTSNNSVRMFVVYIIRTFTIIFVAVVFIRRSIDQKKKERKYFNYLNLRKI